MERASEITILKYCDGNEFTILLPWYRKYININTTYRFPSVGRLTVFFYFLNQLNRSSRDVDAHVTASSQI